MITGKDIHEQFLLGVADLKPVYLMHSEKPWDDLTDESHKMYDYVAAHLNLQLKEQEKLRTLHLEWKIRALEHLVSDMHIFIWELCKWPNTVESDAIAEDLLARAKAFEE